MNCSESKSDQLLKATKEKGQELLERGKVVAQRVGESALDEARQQGLTPEAASETISELAGKVGEVARKAKKEVGTAAKDEKISLEHLKQEASSSAADGIKQDREASAQKKSGTNPDLAAGT
jgi:DNA anti-recombination protein RmuC